MSKRKLVPILGVLATIAAAALPATSFAGTPAPADCQLRAHRVTAVEPYRVAERVGKIAIRRLRGAEIFVQAEPGLTSEWLRLTLSRHVLAMRGPAAMPDCPLDVDAVAVRVDSGGTGFRVRLIARGPDEAKEVLRRARLLLS